ncbi:MAG: hypothetical protein Ta2E_04880 [Mycoplasmoidaceae bacterium]|nr:MAG: hypothetical protein Ta2E_04880 [Mycoplasmoidaceae bacterium]
MGNKEYAAYHSSSQLYLVKKIKGETFVLLQQRKGGWADQMWEAGAAGHIDADEGPADALVHEASEEICVKVNKKDLKFNSVVFKRNKTNEMFYNFSFMCSKWIGEPKIGEPDKTIQLKWFNIKKLPTNIIGDRKVSLSNYLKNIPYSEYVE